MERSVDWEEKGLGVIIKDILIYRDWEKENELLKDLEGFFRELVRVFGKFEVLEVLIKLFIRFCIMEIIWWIWER